MSLKDDITLATSKRPAWLDQEIAFDIVFVMHVSAKGWILEKICREIAIASGLTYTFVYSERNDGITGPIPRARAYFFAHYAIYTFALARHPELHSASLFVWFTHPDFGKGIGIDDLAFALKQADLIFTANAQHASALQLLGIPRKSVATIYGGADPEQFRPKPRGQGKVAFVGAYYERKQPDKMLEVIRSMPDVSFLLLGPSPESIENKGLLWSNYAKFAELAACPNLTIVQTTYEEYAGHFREVDVYVSLSTLEGGPIPLIEALMANAVPVVTRTGFCEELVTDGVNGFLLDTECTVPQVVAAIERARELPTDVSVGSEALSWRSFGEGISAAMQMPLESQFSISFAHGSSGPRRYLREGWNVAEAAGAWQFAKRASVSLRLPKGQALESLRFRFRSGSVFGEVAKFEVRLYLNGHLLGREKLRQNRDCEVNVTNLSPDLSREANILVFDVVSKTHLIEGQFPQLLRLETMEGRTIERPAAPTPGTSEAPKEGEPVLRSQETVREEAIPTRFEFRAGQGLAQVPGSGWHEAEPGGTWSNQTEAYVVIPIEAKEPGTLQLIVTGRVYEPNRARNNKLMISVSDGETDQSFEFSIFDPELRDFEVNYANAGGARVLQVRFSLPFIVSPADIGMDEEDQRKLGFYLSSIRCVTAQPTE